MRLHGNRSEASKPAPHRVEDVEDACREAARSACARILIVEPDPELQFRMARYLTVRGHRVVGATSAAAAHALTREWDVDVLVLDTRVAGEDPLRVAERIQAAQPWVRTLLLGPEADGETKLGAAQRGGAVAFLARPFRLEALSERLDALVAQVRQSLAEPALATPGAE